MLFRNLRAYLSLIALSTALWTSVARAADGVIPINQALAMQGGITPNDFPGFPVTISVPGSYRLTGNLSVADATIDAIEITANSVSLDLNGFEIVGPVNCTLGSGGFVTSCNTSGGGANGVVVTGGRASVRNGTVRGFAGRGVSFSSSSTVPSSIEDLLATSNGSDGIFAFGTLIVKDSNASQNGGSGISVGTAVVQGCIAEANSSIGISTGVATVLIGNTASRNGGPGIFGDRFSVIQDNVASNNQQAGIVTSLANVFSHNVAEKNTGDGISISVGSLATDNAANSNTGSGIVADTGSSVQRNTVTGNGVDGLHLVPTGAFPAAYRANVLNANTASVAGGVSLGANFCQPVGCP